MSNNLSDIVTVTIAVQSAGIQQAGFGVPLVLSANATGPERVNTYESADDMLVVNGGDFSTTDPEYLAVSQIFAQNPAPSEVKVGRLALLPTSTFELSFLTLDATANYGVRIGEEEIHLTGSANRAVLVASGIALVNALSPDSGFTATSAGSGATEHVVLTADTAGAFLPIENLSHNILSIEQTTTNPGIATDLAAINTEDDAWYCLINPWNSDHIVEAAAGWIENAGKMYVAQSIDTPIINDAASGATDVAVTLHSASRGRTAVIYHDASDSFLDAGWAGNVLPLDPGSETWMFKQISGPTATKLTATQKTNLEAKNCNYFYSVGGLSMTSGGSMAKATTFIDNVRFIDWVTARIQEGIAGILANLAKIPYTDMGFALIKGEIEKVLDRGVTVGGFSSDPRPYCTVPRVSTIAANDRIARIASGIKFFATLAGAMHHISVQGTVSV